MEVNWGEGWAARLAAGREARRPPGREEGPEAGAAWARLVRRKPARQTAQKTIRAKNLGMMTGPLKWRAISVLLCGQGSKRQLAVEQIAQKLPIFFAVNEAGRSLKRLL
jgi:hypothetical protein